VRGTNDLRVYWRVDVTCPYLHEVRHMTEVLGWPNRLRTYDYADTTNGPLTDKCHLQAIHFDGVRDPVIQEREEISGILGQQ